MAETIQAMRERRAALAKEARNLLDQNPGASWDKETHGKRYDEIVEDIGRIDDAIGRQQKLNDLEAEQAFTEAGGRVIDEEDPNASPEAKRRSVFMRWVRGGDRRLATEDLAILNTMSVGTDAEGGYTVPLEVAKRVYEALKAYGGMRQVATIIQTTSGATIQYPTSDGTSETGELVAENTAAASQDPTFGAVQLPTYKFSSKVVTVPFELLQDSTVNIEEFINNRLRTRLGRTMNNYFTVGTGTSQPKGVVAAASAGKTGTTGQTTTVIYDDLVDLVHSVDPAYRALGRCRFMLNDDSIKIIRKLKDSQSRPLWVPNFDTGIQKGSPDELLGYPVTVNQDVATMAASAKSILFGDFSFYVIRDVMAVSMFRFTDSAYTSKGQVGFLAWLRSGGTFTDVGGAVKYYANSAT